MTDRAIGLARACPLGRSVGLPADALAWRLGGEATVVVEGGVRCISSPDGVRRALLIDPNGRPTDGTHAPARPPARSGARWSGAEV